MKNKERFEIKDRWLVDTENNYKQIYAVDSYIDRPVIDLLNQQDKEIKQLKQSQKQLAIDKLKGLRDKICDIGYDEDYNTDYFEVMKEIDNQIKSLKGEEK